MASYAKKSSIVDLYSYFIEPIIDFITICVSAVRSFLHINIVIVGISAVGQKARLYFPEFDYKPKFAY